jgi:hypothetical protein
VTAEPTQDQPINTWPVHATDRGRDRWLTAVPQARPVNTPAEVEAELLRLNDTMDAVRIELKRLRNAEVAAKKAFAAARRAWRFSDERPIAGRRPDGSVVLAEDIKEWIAGKTAAEEETYDLAKVARQAASDHLHTLGQQLFALMSVAKSLGISYQGTTGRGGWVGGQRM